MRRGCFTWSYRRSFPESESEGANVDEKDESHGSREAGQQAAERGPQGRVGVGVVGEHGDRQEQHGADQRDKTLLEKTGWVRFDHGYSWWELTNMRIFPSQR